MQTFSFQQLAKCICFLACQALFVHSFAQAEQPLSKAIDQILNEEMAHQELIGAAIGVVNNGQITYLKGYGYSDRKQQEKVTLESTFRWASMAKSLTSITAMKLWEEGKLEVNADVHQYVDNYPKKGVSMAHLLQNQSGIGHYAEMERDYPNWKKLQAAYADNKAYNAYLSVNIFADAPLQSTPGAQYRYSTFGFNLAGAAVDAIGKKNYQKGYVDLVKQYIAQPLGMNSLKPDYTFDSDENEVQGYYKTNAGEILQRNDDKISWKLPAGGFHSNIGDLTKFVQGLMNRKVLKSGTYEKIWTKQDKPDKEGNMVDYGYGFGVNGSGINLRVWHSGSQTKTKTLYFCYPNQGIGVAVMCNSEWANPWIIADRILKVLEVNRKNVAAYEWNCDTKDKKSKHRFAGIWQSGNSDHLVRVAYGYEDFRLECQNLVEKGYSLMDVDTYLDKGIRKWDGVFVKSEEEFVFLGNLKEVELETQQMKMKAKGYHLIDVETYRKSGETQKWAGVFVRGKKKFKLLQNFNQDLLRVFNSFDKQYKELSEQGFRLIDIESYTTIAGTRKWAGVFIGGKGKHALHRNLSKSEFYTKWKELAKDGLRLVDLEVYSSKEIEYWSGVWREGGGKYELESENRFCPFYGKVEELRNEGYELFDLERY